MEAHSVVCVRRNSVELPYIIRTMYMFSTDERPSWLEGLSLSTKSTGSLARASTCSKGCSPLRRTRFARTLAG